MKFDDMIKDLCLFRVKAINDEGESEPLEGDKPFKAKNPFGKFSLTLHFFKVT